MERYLNHTETFNNHRLYDVKYLFMSKSHPHPDNFVRRHIGPAPSDIESMLKKKGYNDLSSFSDAIVPTSIGSTNSLSIPEALSESEAVMKLKKVAS